MTDRRICPSRFDAGTFIHEQLVYKCVKLVRADGSHRGPHSNGSGSVIWTDSEQEASRD